MSTQTVSNTAPQLWELEWTFGDRLRKARRVLGLTTAQMGETLDMTAQGVSNLEARPGTPRAAFALAHRIEETYEVPAWWLLGHENTPDPEGAGVERARRDSNPQPSDPWSEEPSDGSNVLEFPARPGVPLIEEPAA